MRADHHSRIRSRDDEPLCYRNSEGYTDPTAFFALRSVMKESKPTAFSKSIRFTTCAVLVDAYNKGLRTGSKNRLKLEWDMTDDE